MSLHGQGGGWTRRGLIGAAPWMGGAASTAGLFAFVKPPPTGVVVGTWGGDYESVLQQAVAPLMRQAGRAAAYDVADSLSRLTKLRAERHARHGRIDVVLLGEIDMFDAAASGLLAPVSPRAVEALSEVPATLRLGYAVPQMFSAMTLVYSTRAFAAPPRSINVLLDPAMRGRTGLADTLYFYNALFLGAGKSGGRLASFGPGEAFLRDLAVNQPRIYPSNEAIGAALKSGEISLAVMWKARALQWREAGLPIDFLIPEEGTNSVVFEAAVAANARRPTQGFDYLETLLDPNVQAAFATAMGYAPSVSGVTLSRKVSFSPAETKLIYPYDLKPLVAERASFVDFWNRGFKASLS